MTERILPKYKPYNGISMLIFRSDLMSKRPSLFHQMLTSLREQECFGQSKHKAKKLAIKQAYAEGRSSFGAAPEGIYSVVTFAGYRQVAHEFSTWCKQNTQARTMEEARFYTGFYLQERINKGLSAWTIQRDRSALRKIFHDPDLCWEIVVPRRRLSNIKRSRYPVDMDKYFDPAEYPELVDFCKATGLRRHELEVICPKDIYWKDENLIAFVTQGKGGKNREVTVLPGMELRVLQIIEGRQANKPIFDYVPAKMDVHSYRAEYATVRLENAPEELVTRDLGHNRVEVLRGHYIRNS